jgi:tRNA uridine 5-carboxymethylaminomethyl modification enzyme
MGCALGLVSADAARDAVERKAQIRDEIQRIKQTVIKPLPEVNAYLDEKGTQPISNGVHLDQLVKRVELGYDAVDAMAPAPDPIDPRVARQVEIEIKYEGYIQRHLAEIERFKHLEKIRVPDGFDFDRVHGLSNELKEKLSAVRPVSLGQASRISGITPAAISVLMVALKANGSGGQRGDRV